MTTYTKITDFAAKDSLLTGNPSKIVKGSEIGAEFDAIATADASNVKGPTSAVTDNAVMRWDTTTGRISQGSGVTISDVDVVTAAGFSGPHNGTVGATTPSTGAFTTLSATVVTATSGGSADTNPAVVLIGSGTNPGSVSFGTNAGYRIAGGSAYTGIDTVVAGTTITHASTTGLAVTGALSAATLKVGGGSATPSAYLANVTPSGTEPSIELYQTGVESWKLKNTASTTDLVLAQSGVARVSWNGTTGLMNVGAGLSVTGALSATGLIQPQQAPTASAPTYVKGAIYFDTTLNKLRVGGAAGWETITSA